jgi:hypothetical protein
MTSWVWLIVGVFELAGAVSLIHLKKLVAVNVTKRGVRGIRP